MPQLYIELETRITCRLEAVPAFFKRIECLQQSTACLEAGVCRRVELHQGVRISSAECNGISLQRRSDIIRIVRHSDGCREHADNQ